MTGGVNDEGIALASRHSLICALRGDGQGALRHLDRVDALAAASGEAEALGHRPLTRCGCWRWRRQGRSAQALDLADAMQAHLASLNGPPPGAPASRARHRAAALGLACESGRSAAEAALSIAAEGGCIGLEHGLALAEAARCSLAAGEPANAALQWRAALATWEAGQVDGPEVLQPVHAELALLQAAH